MNVFNYATPGQSISTLSPSLLDRIGKFLVVAMRNRQKIAPVAKQPEQIGEFRHGDYSAANRNTKLYPATEAANRIVLITTLQSMR